MLGIRVKIERETAPVWRDLPRYGRKLLLAAGILSIFLHLVSIISAYRFSGWSTHQPLTDASKVKIRVMDPSTSTKEQLKGKKIIETPLVETTPPKTSDYMGPQDHAVEKETKLAKKFLNNDRSLDPGTKGKQEAKDTLKSQPTTKQIISGSGTLAIPGSMPEPRNAYEKLLPKKESDVFGSPTAGHAEYIDANIPESDRLDMNTTQFRYISYFTGMRKAIEMVWIYPREAVERGLQGEVQLELIIEKDGKVSRIRIVNSSGYSILDDNMVKTIKLATPFAPLPKGWKKERIMVTGAFHYILSYGAH